MDQVFQSLGRGMHRSLLADLELFAESSGSIRELPEPRMNFVFRWQLLHVRCIAYMQTRAFATAM